MINCWQHFLKRVHPEGIPWLGSVLYNALAGTRIFLRHYELVADDVAHYGPTEHILDIGTGPGSLLLAMRRKFPKAHLIGIDISPAMIAQAQRNMEKQGSDPHIEVRTAGANALPFANGTFDRVVTTGSLHHWKDPVQALSETHRVLKPGSYALLYDLVRDMPLTVRKQVQARFGGFRLALLWLHSFEEPFLKHDEMMALGTQTEFMVEGVRFVGALCCLVLRKASIPERNQNDTQGQLWNAD
jgi:SAM-dependent methyltransferase